MNINPFDILKNAQKVQEQMGSFQERLGGITVTGSAGGGMVEVDLNGRIDLLGIRISPEVLASPDVEMLQDLIAAAFNNAMDKVREAINLEMSNMAGSLGLPGLPGMIPGFPGSGLPGPR